MLPTSGWGLSAYLPCKPSDIRSRWNIVNLMDSRSTRRDDPVKVKEYTSNWHFDPSWRQRPRGNNEEKSAPERMQMPVNASAGKHTSMHIASVKIRKSEKTTHVYPMLERKRYREENPLGSQRSKSSESKPRQNLSLPSCSNVQPSNMLNVPPAYGREKLNWLDSPFNHL